jgi:hypothetical protein
MRQRSWLVRFIGLSTLAVLMALAFLLRWRGRVHAKKPDPSE